MIFSFDNNKVPSSDGFLRHFYKNLWNILKTDILKVSRDFHRNGILNKNPNNTSIAFIAKKDNCSQPKDFRPIILTTSLYKILAKAIANRFKPTFSNTINENQLDFLEGRQITDAILMVNEAVDFWRVSKKKGFVIKLDIEKSL